MVADSIDLAPEVDAIIEEAILHAAGPLVVSVAELVLRGEPSVLVEVSEPEVVNWVLVRVCPLVVVQIRVSAEMNIRNS